jgi:hypothetical protein
MTAVISVRPEYVELFVRFLKEKDYAVLPIHHVQTTFTAGWAVFNVDIDTWINIHDVIHQNI